MVPTREILQIPSLLTGAIIIVCGIMIILIHIANSFTPNLKVKLLVNGFLNALPLIVGFMSFMQFSWFDIEAEKHPYQPAVTATILVFVLACHWTGKYIARLSGTE